MPSFHHGFGIPKQYVTITVHTYFVLNVIKLCKLMSERIHVFITNSYLSLVESLVDKQLTNLIARTTTNTESIQTIGTTLSKPSSNKLVSLPDVHQIEMRMKGTC